MSVPFWIFWPAMHGDGSSAIAAHASASSVEARRIVGESGGFVMRRPNTIASGADRALARPPQLVGRARIAPATPALAVRPERPIQVTPPAATEIHRAAASRRNGPCSGSLPGAPV